MDDFLVIGGGIAGLSAGARLAELGRVTLLEAEDALGTHASGRSAALHEGNYGLPPVVALARASYDALEQDGLLSPRGLMFIGGPSDEEQHAREIASFGLHSLSIDEARAHIPVLDPSRVTLAAWHEAAYDIDTDRLMQGYARAIRTNGQIETRARVAALRRLPNGWEADTGGKTYTAHRLVNAAGAWVDEIARLAGLPPLGFTPMRRSMACVPAPEGHDASHWPMTLGAGESWYMKPDGGSLFISPADSEPTEPHDAWADDMTLAEGIAGWEAHVTTPVTRMISNWAGLRTFAPDNNLVIGPAPTDDTFLWFAGQGGYGFQTAPAASQLLADRAAGRPPSIDKATQSATSPTRFN